MKALRRSRNVEMHPTTGLLRLRAEDVEAVGGIGWGGMVVPLTLRDNIHSKRQDSR